jgi:hypothetical protein
MQTRIYTSVPNQSSERNHGIYTTSEVMQKISNVLQNVADSFAQQLVILELCPYRKRTEKCFNVFIH